MRKILFVTYQPGSANNLVLIARRFQRMMFDIAVVAVNGSRCVWSRAGFDIFNESDDMGQLDVQRTVSALKPALIVAGTSNEDSVESMFLKAAKEYGVKTVSFVDFWSKLRGRFLLSGELVVPEKILVLDDIMREEMVREGFDPQVINVVGSPHLENVRSCSRKLYDARSGASAVRIAFFSQPIAELYGEDERSPNWFGYHEGTIVKSLVSCLDRVCYASDVRVGLTIGIHPRERDGEVVKAALHDRNDHSYNRALSVTVVKEDSLKLINEADIVLGMTTIVLLESAIMGKDTLSIQINNNGRFNFKATELGLIDGVFTEEDLFNKLSSLCLGMQMKHGNIPDKRNKLAHLYKGASDKFINVCRAYL